MVSTKSKFCFPTSRILAFCVAAFISLSALCIVSAALDEPRRCYWCGPLAEQVHRSQRAAPCTDDADHITACESGLTHCAVVATSPPHIESRYCVKLYQDECYPLYCNSTKMWKMICPCRGDLCNGPKTSREKEAFAILAKLVAKTHNIRIKKRTIITPSKDGPHIINVNTTKENNIINQHFNDVDETEIDDIDASYNILMMHPTHSIIDINDMNISENVYSNITKQNANSQNGDDMQPEFINLLVNDVINKSENRIINHTDMLKKEHVENIADEDNSDIMQSDQPTEIGNFTSIAGVNAIDSKDNIKNERIAQNMIIGETTMMTTINIINRTINSKLLKSSADSPAASAAGESQQNDNVTAILKSTTTELPLNTYDTTNETMTDTTPKSIGNNKNSATFIHTRSFAIANWIVLYCCL